MIFQVNVDECVLHHSAHKEFKREVVHPFRVVNCVVLLSIVPCFDQSVTDGVRSSLECTEVVEVKTGAS